MSRMVRWLDALLIVWAVGAMAVALAHVALPRWVAAGTNWGYSPGWPREVGLWNAGLAVLLLQALLAKNLGVKLSIVRTLGVIALLIGTNHVLEVLRGGHTAGHLIWAGANYAAAILGAIVLIGTGRDGRWGEGDYHH